MPAPCQHTGARTASVKIVEELYWQQGIFVEYTFGEAGRMAPESGMSAVNRPEGTALPQIGVLGAVHGRQQGRPARVGSAASSGTGTSAIRVGRPKGRSAKAKKAAAAAAAAGEGGQAHHPPCDVCASMAAEHEAAKASDAAADESLPDVEDPRWWLHNLADICRGKYGQKALLCPLRSTAEAAAVTSSAPGSDVAQEKAAL